MSGQRRTPERTEQAEIVKLLQQQAKPSKYRNVKTTVDGIVFDSKKEARRYQELCLLQKAGEIEALSRQVRYSLYAHSCDNFGPQEVATFVADFAYVERATSRTVVEDVKGGNATKTPLYRLKKKLMKACHDIDILET